MVGCALYANSPNTYRRLLGIFEKLVRQESQLRGEVVSVVNSKLCTSQLTFRLKPVAYQPLGAITGNQANRMIYKNFDKNITRKHGVVIEGWPLKMFDNPSSIGSQVELKILLTSWMTGVTHFRKMSAQEHMAWKVDRSSSSDCPNVPGNPPHTSLPPLQTQFCHLDLADLNSDPLSSHSLLIRFESPAAPPADTNSTPGKQKKPWKTRSDKGKPRKRPSQIPGGSVFSVGL